MYNYIGVLQTSSAITHCLKCNFMGEKIPNFIFTKGEKLHIFNITQEGLKPQNYLSIFGKIALILSFPSSNPKNKNQDDLFIMSDDLDYSILSYDRNTKIINTQISGSIKEDIGKRQDNILYALDVDKNFLLISAYNNIFRLICLSQNYKFSNDQRDFKFKNGYSELLFLENFAVNYFNYEPNYEQDKSLVTFALIKVVEKEKSQNQITSEDAKSSQNIESEEEIFFETIQFKIESNSIKQLEYEDKLSLTNGYTNLSLNVTSFRASKYNPSNSEANKISVKNTHKKQIEEMNLLQKIDITENPTVSQMITHPNGLVLLFFVNHCQLYKYNMQSKKLEIQERSQVSYTERKFMVYSVVDLKTYRYITVDEYGNLFLIAVIDPFKSEETISSENELLLQFLGEVNYASCLCYLDNNYLFVGSKQANSQLVKIEKSKNGFIEIVENYEALCPINDFTIINNIQEENGIELITISGTEKFCSLKNIRKGTTVIFKGELEIKGIKSVFKISLNKNIFIINTMVNSFCVEYDTASNSLFLYDKIKFSEGEIVYFADVYEETIIIVSNVSIYIYKDDQLICRETLEEIPLLVKFNKKLKALIIYNNKKMLNMYNINRLNDGNCNITKRTLLHGLNISAFDLTQYFLVFGLWDSHKIGILTLKDSLNVNYIENINENLDYIQISSIQIMKNNGIKYIFISLSNGRLLYLKLKEKFRNLGDYIYTQEDFIFKRKYNLSNENFLIKKIGKGDNASLFVNTYNPSLIYMNKEILIISNFNIRNCNDLIPLSNSNSSNEYAFIFNDSITFGTLSNTQTQNVISKHYGKQIANIKLISFFDENKLSPIIDSQNNSNNNNISPQTNLSQNNTKAINYILMLEHNKLPNEKTKSSLVLSDLNLKEISRFDLEIENEMATCFTELSMLQSTAVNSKLFVIGTGVIENTCDEPAIGHLYLIEMNINNNYSMKKLQDFETKGGVYKLISCQNILYVAIGNTIYIYKVNKQKFNYYEFKLLKKNSEFTLINDLYLFRHIYIPKDNYSKTSIQNKQNKSEEEIEAVDILENLSEKDNNQKSQELSTDINIHQFLVSDLYRSVTLFTYDAELDRLYETCKDYNLTWVFSVTKCLGNMVYISDIDGNISSLEYELNPKSDQDKFKLQKKAFFNFGERINVLNTTKIKDKELFEFVYEEENNAEKEIALTYFATLEGSIGIIVQLKKEVFEFLLVLQETILKRVNKYGNFDYKCYRSSKDGFNMKPSEGFVEGEILLEFMNYDEEIKKSILNQMNYPWKKSVEETMHLLEVLAKLH